MFHIKFSISMLMYMRQVDGVSVQLQITWEKVVTQTTPSLPIHEHGVSSLWTLYTQSFNMVYPVHEHGVHSPWTWYTLSMSMVHPVHEHDVTSSWTWCNQHMNTVHPVYEHGVSSHQHGMPAPWLLCIQSMNACTSERLSFPSTVSTASDVEDSHTWLAPY